jgi:hypothetical protein
LLLAIRASRQAVKEGLGESDIQRALEIERSFEKLYSSVDAECYAGRILMGWRNVNRTNRSAKVIDNNNAVVIDSDRFQELAGRQKPSDLLHDTHCASSAPKLFVPQRKWRPSRSRQYLTLISGARYGEEDP